MLIYCVTRSSSFPVCLCKDSSIWIHYLKKRGVGPILHPLDALWHSSVRLQVVQVERLFAGAQDARDGRAVAYSEADLHVDALRRPPVDVSGEEPVVLAGLKHVAHLVRPDGVEVLIIAAYLLPLRKVCVCVCVCVCEAGAGVRMRGEEVEKEGRREAKMINGFTETWHKLNFPFPSLPFCLPLLSCLPTRLPHSLFFPPLPCSFLSRDNHSSQLEPLTSNTHTNTHTHTHTHTHSQPQHAIVTI